jgi:hypothetical protein
MDQATPLWGWWLSWLSAFAPVFTRPGWVRVVQGVTGMVRCWEEHPLTQILTAMRLESRWRVLEHVAAYGVWDREAVERQTLRLIGQEQPGHGGRYHPVAIDDTTGHRTSQQVWGTCPCHEASARSPNRAETVRAHHWVVMGQLVPGHPWLSVPHAARLYFRQHPRPTGETSRTQTALAAARLRQADAESVRPMLAVFEGAYAVDTVVRPCVESGPGQRRLAIVTRRRADARLYPPVRSRPPATGRPPKGGVRIAAPPHHVYWPVAWQPGQAWVYGRTRRFRDNQRRCRWAVSGPSIPVHLIVVEMAGYEAPWCLVTSALELSAGQVVEVFTARFRHEAAIRDHTPRLGLAECRAWTTEPILRTFHVQSVAMTLLRPLQTRLDHAWGSESWWCKAAWHHRKRHPSSLDRRRLFWQYRVEFSPFLLALEDLEKIPPSLGPRGNLPERAA